MKCRLCSHWFTENSASRAVQGCTTTLCPFPLHLQVESSALLEQKQKYDAEIKGLQDQMAGLQAQLRQNTERSAKMRQHFERWEGEIFIKLLDDFGLGPRDVASTCMRAVGKWHDACPPPHTRRDKKALQAQLDKVTKTLEGVDAEHTSKVRRAWASAVHAHMSATEGREPPLASRCWFSRARPCHTGVLRTHADGGADHPS